MDIVLRPSRWRHAAMVLGSLAFVAGGVFMLVIPPSPGKSATEQHLIGWCGIVFFGACALIGVWELLDSRPRLMLTDEGLLDRGLGVGYIPWWEIRDAYVRVSRGTPFLCLDLYDSDKYLDRAPALKRALAKTNAAMGFTPIAMNLAGLGADPYDLLELVRRRIDGPADLG